MKPNHNITFVIPAYNAASTLVESVDSIFDGNFETGDEVIIVDDCSTDKTLEVARFLEQKYSPSVTVIHNGENRGCPASRNIGIIKAKNDLIFNLDSDNVLASKMINSLRDGLLREGADVAAFGEYDYFKQDKSQITHKWICKPGVFILADLFAGTINPGPGGNFLYRKELWQRIGGYWEYGKGLHEAWGFSFKMLIHGAKFIVVPHTFYYHRYSHESLFVRENSKINASAAMSNKFISPFLSRFDEDSKKYIIEHDNWFYDLDKRPLHLKDGSRGTNGKLVFTAPLKQLLYRISRLMRMR